MYVGNIFCDSSELTLANSERNMVSSDLKMVNSGPKRVNNEPNMNDKNMFRSFYIIVSNLMC